MLSLRTADGLDLERYHATAGSDLLSAKRSEIESLTEAGLLELRGNCLKPTETGLLMAEDIAARLA